MIWVLLLSLATMIVVSRFLKGTKNCCGNCYQGRRECNCVEKDKQEP
jgi:hypothetical protein